MKVKGDSPESHTFRATYLVIVRGTREHALNKIVLPCEHYM
jgi:hypothetical protein